MECKVPSNLLLHPNFLSTLNERVEDILADFSDFIDGTRVSLLLQRAKEGGHNKEQKRRRARYISHDREQFKKSLFELLLLQATIAPECRIYSTVNPRDVRRAEMEFKRLMLDMDFTEGENKKYFYEHIEDKWISALMSTNPIKNSRLFILDIDTKDDGPVMDWIDLKGIEVVKKYPTKQGWHIVVKPFNRTWFPEELGGVKEDGLLLLAY